MILQHLGYNAWGGNDKERVNGNNTRISGENWFWHYYKWRLGFIHRTVARRLVDLQGREAMRTVIGKRLQFRNNNIWESPENVNYARKRICGIAANMRRRTSLVESHAQAGTSNTRRKILWQW